MRKTGYTARMKIDWNWLQGQIIGRDATINTPYGQRLLTYADFTASGRGLHFIERYVEHVLELYANTHTEDDSTGRITSRRLAEAEHLIKKHLNAEHGYKLISLGSGATGAINRLQQILGIHIPPATKDRLERASEALGRVEPAGQTALFEQLNRVRPVVFVGPYEHHSNEISWREGFAEVVEVELDAAGYIDLSDLETKLRNPAFEGRQKIGSFSAASNVTGLRTDVYAVARLLHRYNALAFFDFSACAPYVEINVNRDEQAYFDGVFFSPHKYLGGPGSSGILVIRESIYRKDLPPSVAGGGTVTFVNAVEQDYVEDIEEREKAGTPGILQTIRAALAIDLQRAVGVEAIERREAELMGRAVERLCGIENVEIMCDARVEDRLAILSFNVRSGRGYLHPRFVVRLLNDLFGIQARAGCSCAGPYGHRLLKIDLDRSNVYRRYINQGHNGLKPGWVRLNFHYLMSDQEFDYVCNAIEFVAQSGRFFLQEYTFDLAGGGWEHHADATVLNGDASIGIAAAIRLDAAAQETPSGTADGALGAEQRAEVYRSYLSEAQHQAQRLAQGFAESALHGTDGDGLIPFWYMEQVHGA